MEATACHRNRWVTKLRVPPHENPARPDRTPSLVKREPKRARPLFGRQKVTSLSEELRAVPDTQLLPRMFLIKLGSVRANRLASSLMG